MDTSHLSGVLVRFAFLIQGVFAELSQELELTPQQAQLLCVVRDGPVSMAELADRLRLERSSLTGLVDRAHRRGLVERENDAADRRVVRVTLTTAGRQAAERFHAEVSGRLGGLLDDLPEPLRTQVSVGLCAVVTHRQVPELLADEPVAGEAVAGEA
jgi:DNA-binding MarR family transcriptional regulator